MRTYAIGDIHGHLDKLIAAHERIAADRRRTGDVEAPVIHLGDLVDRGPDSRGVIEHLMEGIAAGEPWKVLKGNHDRLMSLFLRDPPQSDQRLRRDLSWISDNLGGTETLFSYGINVYAERDLPAAARQAVPPQHAAFLESLPTSLARGDVFFAHAGIRPGIPLDVQTEDDLLWIRGEFHADTRDHGALIVHGHTPVDAPSNYGNRVNLDSGAAFGGPLTAAVFEGRDVWVLEDDGRVPLPPP